MADEKKQNLSIFYDTSCPAIERYDEDDGSEKPKMWHCVMKYGVNPYTIDGKVGEYKFAREDADNIVNEFKQRAKNLVFDFDHSSLKDDSRGAPANGWGQDVEARDDGLYVLVEWLPDTANDIKSGKYKYLSPVMINDDDTGLPISLHSVALTNHPSLHNPPIALAANDLSNDKEVNKFDDAMELLNMSFNALQEAKKGAAEAIAFAYESAGDVNENKIKLNNFFNDKSDISCLELIETMPSFNEVINAFQDEQISVQSNENSLREKVMSLMMDPSEEALSELRKIFDETENETDKEFISSVISRVEEMIQNKKIADEANLKELEFEKIADAIGFSDIKNIKIDTLTEHAKNLQTIMSDVDSFLSENKAKSFSDISKMILEKDIEIESLKNKYQTEEKERKVKQIVKNSFSDINENDKFFIQSVSMGMKEENLEDFENWMKGIAVKNKINTNVTTPIKSFSDTKIGNSGECPKPLLDFAAKKNIPIEDVMKIYNDL